MPALRPQIVLGSRSPRRLELLRLVVPAEAIEVVPPRLSDEPGFDGLHDWPAIEQRLLEIARAKWNDVLQILLERESAHNRAGKQGGAQSEPPDTILVAADTVIVAADSSAKLHVLPQPPDDAAYADTLRRWFREFYAGKTHAAITALCVSKLRNRSVERIVRSQVTFADDVDRWLEWYLATGEPRGKAGGYALQGAGSLFVERVEGSLSNVVGLPLRELLEALDELCVPVVHDTPSRK